MTATKEQIEKLLAEDERARESDLWFLISAWRKQGSRIYVNYEDFVKMSEPQILLDLKKEALGQGIKAKEPEKKPKPKTKDKPKGTKIKG